MTHDILFEIRLEKMGNTSYVAKLYYDLKVYGDEIEHAVSKMIQDIWPFLRLAQKIPPKFPEHDVIEISRLRGDIMMWRGIYRDTKTVESYVIYGYGWQDNGYEDLIICKLAGEQQFCIMLYGVPIPNTSAGVIIIASELLKGFYAASLGWAKQTEIFTMGKTIRIVL